MSKTIFELKQDLTTIGQQIQKTNDEMMQKAADTGATTEELIQIRKTKESLQQRFDIIKTALEEKEAEQKASLAKGQFSTADDPNQKLVDAKAELIRATMQKKPVSDEVLNMVSGSKQGNMFQALLDDVETTGGAHFIPKNTGTNVISEPAAKNPLRGLSTITTIANLELPKLSFSIDDDEFVEDGETAKELKAKGSVVTFGRHKSKIFSDLSETVVNGTNTDLVSTVEENLQGGVQYKEKSVAFATNPTVEYQKHMSFYDETEVKIGKITGATLFEAIIAAAADLEDFYSENASVLMRKSDYFKMIKEISNGSVTLYGRQPEEVLGYPVTFCDKAVIPVVGDFRYSHFNYFPDALYEQDKNIKTGMHSFVVTTWYDHQIKLSSAFRLAVVDENTEPLK